jgi:hypothetical protein
MISSLAQSDEIPGLGKGISAIEPSFLSPEPRPSKCGEQLSSKTWDIANSQTK